MICSRIYIKKYIYIVLFIYTKMIERWEEGYSKDVLLHHLYGDAAKRSSNDSRDGERAVLLQGVRSIWTDELGVIHLGKRRSYKLQSLKKNK